MPTEGLPEVQAKNAPKDSLDRTSRFVDCLLPSEPNRDRLYNCRWGQLEREHLLRLPAVAKCSFSTWPN